MGLTREFLKRALAGQIASLGSVFELFNAQVFPSGDTVGDPVDFSFYPGSLKVVLTFGEKTVTTTTQRVRIYEGPTDTGPWTLLYDTTALDLSQSTETATVTPTKPWLRTTVTLAGTPTVGCFISGVALSAPAPILGYDLALVGLFTDVIDRGLDTTLADLTLATASLSSTHGLMSIGVPTYLIDGSVVSDLPLGDWSPVSSADAQTIKGWFVYDSTGPGTLLYWDYLPQPVTLGDENSQLSLVLRPHMDASARWWSVVSWGSQ